jgi:thioesterase domain-containing protein/acyl carrier protein
VADADTLPRTATGKLNRKALSESSLNASPAFRGSTQPHHNRDKAPRDATEAKIAEIWAELLPGTQPGIHDDFFELGGHSLKAVVLMSRIEKELGAMLPLPFIFEARTIAQLAVRVKQQTAALAQGTKPSLLVPLQTKGTRTPLVLLHALGGHVLFYRELAEAMGSHRPVYAMQALGSDGASTPYTDVASMAKHYVQELESAGLLHQPLILGGFCFGAYLAIEMAALVEARGGKVPLLIAFDTDGEWRTVSSVADSVRFHARQLQRRGLGGWPDYFRERLFSRRRRKRIQRLGAIQLAKLRQGQRLNSEEAIDAVWAANALASERYKPKPFTQPLLYLKGVDAPPRDPSIFWGPLAQGGLEILEMPGREFSMFEQPAAGVLAERLTWRINASEGPAEAPASQAAAAGQAAR